MRFFIASDIHGSATALDALAKRIEEFCPDKVLLLGDLLYHGPRNDLPEGYAPKQAIPVLNGMKDRIVAIRGNCDAEVDQMVLEFSCMDDYAAFMADGKKFLMTHGHVEWPASETPDVILSGHTHIKVLEERDGVVYVNPGSPSIPKDGIPSYATYEDGIFRLHSLNGTVLKKF